MTHIKTLAVSLFTLAAIAVPAAAVDHRDNGHKQSHINTSFGIDMNFGNLRISNSRPVYQNRYQRPSRVYIVLDGGRNHRDHNFSRFQQSVRHGFARQARGRYELVSSPRHADFILRLGRDDWGSAYHHYARASKHGRYPQRYEMRGKMIDQVSHRLMTRAYDMRKKHYSHGRYGRYDDRRRSGHDYYKNDRRDHHKSSRDDRYRSSDKDRRQVRYTY